MSLSFLFGRTTAYAKIVWMSLLWHCSFCNCFYTMTLNKCQCEKIQMGQYDYSDSGSLTALSNGLCWEIYFWLPNFSSDNSCFLLICLLTFLPCLLFKDWMTLDVINIFPLILEDYCWCNIWLIVDEMKCITHTRRNWSVGVALGFRQQIILRSGKGATTTINNPNDISRVVIVSTYYHMPCAMNCARSLMPLISVITTVLQGMLLLSLDKEANQRVQQNKNRGRISLQTSNTDHQVP